MARLCWCSLRRELIWEESFSRVARASWMQSSRLERRIRASKEEVGWTPWVGSFDGWKDVGLDNSSKGRSVKLV